MSEEKTRKDSQKREEKESVEKKSERACCYIVDPCGCYADPCCCGPSVMYCR
jgi:hypothetical protein